MFQISKVPLEEMNLREGFSSDEAGAFNCFEGRVRNKNQGCNVSMLEYEAHEILCIKEGEKVIKEALEKFDIIAVKCVHRVGKLEIGEIAVWAGVLSGHRKASFDACQYVVDELKKRLPIWKKEHYLDGNSGWIGCDEDAQKVFTK